MRLRGEVDHSTSSTTVKNVWRHRAKFTLPILILNLVNDQLDAQFFYFIIRLLQSSICFQQRRAHHQ